jgi:hypothetical protein
LRGCRGYPEYYVMFIVLLIVRRLVLIAILHPL